MTFFSRHEPFTARQVHFQPFQPCRTQPQVPPSDRFRLIC